MRCLITGTSGYVGSMLASAFERKGIDVVRLQRRAGPGAIPYELGKPIDISVLRDADCLVHCAWDMQAVTDAENTLTNIEGSNALLRAAKSAGVKRIVFISSISAFSGCRSLYGRSKLAVESLASSLGAVIIRPGLVYGESSGSMVGKLARLVEEKTLVPVVAPNQPMYSCHEEDLAALVLRAASGELDAVRAPITAACARPITMRSLLNLLASRQGKKIVLLPLPWQVVWLGLKTLETVGLRPGFKSDSLIGMVYGNPSPNLALTEKVGAVFRELGAQEADPARVSVAHNGRR